MLKPTNFQALILNFFNISGGEIFIILIVVFLIFGPDKIPEIARWLGKGVGEIKKATSDIRDEISRETGDIKKEADNLKRDLHVDNPLRKNPTAEHSEDKPKEERQENTEKPDKNRDPHL